MNLPRLFASGTIMFLGAATCPAVVLPLTDDFEVADGYIVGPVTEGNGWTFSASLSANGVNSAFSGDQALSLLGDGWLNFTADSWVSGVDGSVTWIDFYLKPVFIDATALPTEANTALAAVTDFVKQGASLGEVYALDGDGTGGGVWTATGYTTPTLDAQSTGWVRISYRIDYVNDRWDLFVDGNLVMADLGFADDAASPFAQFRIRSHAAKSTFLDYFYVGAENPLFTDTSGTGLPDSWFLAHGLDASTAQRYGDPDGDGLSNLDEYQQGRIPSVADSGPIGSAWYVNNVTGNDTAYNGQSAAPNLPVAGDGPKATLSAALVSASSNSRIIISASETVYSESTIPLAGKDLVLRPHGSVRITSP